LIEGPSPLKHRIPRVKAEPNFAEIGLILAIEKETNELIGSAGFHDFPDNNGMIEIGFGIVPEKQNQGFGTELLIGMWKMICLRPDVRLLRYTVSPENLPSMHIINKIEFSKVGQQMDPEDGLELIYERLTKDFQSALP
jgi:RimJ/RimL family protein N-acetyltransferase